MSGESPSSSPLEPTESAASSSATCADIPSTKLPSTINSLRAVEAFKTQLDALITQLQSNLSAVATSLYSKSIISQAELQEAKREMVIPKTRTENLLIVVLNKIKHEPQMFVDFIKILETEPSQREQANELVLCYEATASSASTPPISLSVDPTHQSSKPPGGLEDKIARMEKDFEKLVNSVEESFVDNEISLREVQKSLKHIPVSLKRDLGKYFRKESLEAESIEEFFLTLSCYWDYLNPGLLEFLVGRFGSGSDTVLLNTYLTKLEQFRSEVKLGEYVKRRQRNISINGGKIYKEITAIMGHDWEEKTLQDAENYKNELADECHIQRVFGRIQVTRSSIALIFYVPHWFEVKKEKLELFFREQNVRKVYLDDVCFIDWTEQAIKKFEDQLNCSICLGHSPLEPAVSGSSSSATCAATPSTKLPSTIDASRAVEAFKTRLEALTTLLQHNLTDISTSLFTKSIISQAEQQKAMSETPIPKARTVTLLNAVLSKIKFEPQVFVDFVKILETAPALLVQANELVLCYQATAASQASSASTPPISFPTDIPHQSSKPPGGLEDKIARMEKDFEELVDSVEESFVDNEISLREVQKSLKHIPVSLKRDLGKYFRKESLEAESIKELFFTLSKYWDYLNPGLLEFLVQRFGTSYDEVLLAAYLEKLERFRSKVKLGDYVKITKRSVSTSTYKEIISIMGPGWEDKTLQDAEDFKNEIGEKSLIQPFLRRINVHRT